MAEKVKRMTALLLVVMTVLVMQPMSVMAAGDTNGEYEGYMLTEITGAKTSGQEDYYIRKAGSDETGKVVYCYDHGKYAPKRKSQDDKPTYDLHDYFESGVGNETISSMGSSAHTISSVGVTKENIAALLYAGYPVNGTGLKEKFSYSDEYARYDTQDALWTLIGYGFDSYYNESADYESAICAYAKANPWKDGSVTITGETELTESDGVWKSGKLTLSGDCSGKITLSDSSGKFKFYSDEACTKEITTAEAGDSFYAKYVVGSGTPDKSTEIKGIKHEKLTVEFYVTHDYWSDSDKTLFQNLIRADLGEEDVALTLTAASTAQTVKISKQDIAGNNAHVR